MNEEQGNWRGRVLTIVLINAAVVAALFLALGDANDRSPAKRYPAPLVTWARNMNERIDGAQCETIGDVMICDVRTGDTKQRVKCDSNTCRLEFMQENR